MIDKNLSKKKIVIKLLTVFCLLPTLLLSQKYEKRADQYIKVGNYGRAIKDLNRELKRNNSKEIHSKLAYCYLKSNVNKGLAISHTAFLIKNDTTPELLLNHAKAQYYNYYFDKAISNFDKVLKITKSSSEIYKEANRYEKWILNAQAFIKQPIDVSFINMGSAINTKQSELNPFVTANENVLVYSSDKRYHSYAGVNYFNVNISKREKNKWSNTKTVGSAINSPYDEIVAGYHPNGEELFVFHNRKGTEILAASSYLGGGRFSELKDMEDINSSKKGAFGISLTLSTDTMFFAAENKNGDTDIYYSIKLPNGKYAQARSISDNINTAGDENFPVLSYDGKRLYFSSDGENSMGGSDIFYSEYNAVLKEWGTPINMGYPLNDLYDNYSISWVKDQRSAYVSAVRPEGLGERDIYKVVFNNIDVNPLIIKGSVVQEMASDNDLIESAVIISLSDTLNTEILGMYRCSGDSANFVMALNPGYYSLSFEIDGEEVHTEKIEVSDMYYSNEAQKRLFVMPKKEDETESDK